MSHRTVGVVIHRLLTDENLRVQFAINPIEALAEVSFRELDLELTPEEIEVFVRTDPRMWFWSDLRPSDRMH